MKKKNKVQEDFNQKGKNNLKQPVLMYLREAKFESMMDKDVETIVRTARYFVISKIVQSK